MVKRQTVWLSTMMVLSLMLIGYYTMNNQSATTSADNTGTAVSTTSVTSPPATGNQTGSSNGGSTASSGSTNPGSTSTAPSQSQTSTPASDTSSTNDWFVGQQTSLEQHLSEQISNLQAVIANNNASTDTISQAEQSLQKLENLKGNLAEARDAIIGDGFKECVIVPTAANANMQVYVKGSTLSSQDVIKIMNIVSQQLDIPMVNVIVTTHS